jgi:hypothetical protein
MAISARTRRKRTAATQKLLPDMTIISYSDAVSGPNPKQVSLGIVGGAVAISLVVFALTHLVVFPGLLVLILVKNAINPGRGVVVDNFGVAIVERAIITGRPKRSLRRIPRDHIPPFEAKGALSMMALGEPLWLTKGERHELETGLAQAQPLARA